MDKEDETSGTAAQGCRADLRERFLLAVTTLAGQRAGVRMTDGVDIQGTLRAVDKDVLLAQMEDLQTPFTAYPMAKLRLPDCYSFTFNM